MQVSFEYAEEHFAELVAAVDAGHEVEIVRPDKPSLKLVLAHEPSPVKGNMSA